MTPVYGLEKGDKVETSTKKNGCLGLPGLGGGSNMFYKISSLFGEDEPIWTKNIISDGLVQPPTRNAGFALLIHR